MERGIGGTWGFRCGFVMLDSAWPEAQQGKQGWAGEQWSHPVAKFEACFREGKG